MLRDPTQPSDTVTLRTGAEMPVMGLGTWQLTHETARTVEAALAAGYRLIDTSSDYGTQPGVAEALARSDVDRSDVYLVTKVEEDEDAYTGTLDRLQELGVDRVELMLIHRPPPSGTGTELWRGLQRARDEGLTTDIGVSNYSIEQMEELADETGELPAVNQIEWSPFGWSPDMYDYCQRRGVTIQAYSPLTRANRLDDDILDDIASELGRTPAQVLIRWNIERGVVPLPKANQLDHLDENLRVFDFELSDRLRDALDGRNELYSALGDALAYA